MAKKNAGEKIAAVAELLDRGGRIEAPIRTHYSRKHLMRYLKPEQPGAALFFGRHEIVRIDKVTGLPVQQQEEV